MAKLIRLWTNKKFAPVY